MEKIKILVGDKGYVDFESPLSVSEKQKNLLLDLLRSLFSFVELELTDEFREYRIGEKKTYPRPWTAEEYDILLSSNSLDEASERLGRSGAAVQIRDGDWRWQLSAWCEKNKKNLFKGNRLQIIKEFIKENKDRISQRRKTRSDITRKKHEIEDLEAGLPEVRKHLELQKNLGMITNKEFMDKLAKLSRDVSEKKKDLAKLENEYEES